MLNLTCKKHLNLQTLVYQYVQMMAIHESTYGCSHHFNVSSDYKEASATFEISDSHHERGSDKMKQGIAMISANLE